jgi:hypothetical protein
MIGEYKLMPDNNSKFSEDAFLLRHDAETLQKLIPTFRRNVMPLSSKVDCVPEDCLFLVTPLLLIRQVFCANHDLAARYPDFALFMQQNSGILPQVPLHCLKPDKPRPF